MSHRAFVTSKFSNFLAIAIAIAGVLLPHIATQKPASAQEKASNGARLESEQDIDCEIVSGTAGRKIDEYIRRAETFGFDGVVLVEQEGRLILHQAYGFSDRKSLRKHNVTTVFDIGSIAKMLTAATLIRLADAGELRLDAKLDELIPNVPSDKAEISLLQLLAHKSGLRRSLSFENTSLTHHQIGRSILSSDLAAEVGEQFRYSNSGYTLIAAIIEQNSKDGWQANLHKTIQAAGLEHTGFYQEIPANRIARGYWEQDDAGSASEWQFDWGQTGNGHVLSTTGDLLRWVRALERGEVVARGSLKRMVTPQNITKTDVPDSGYGLGVELRTDAAGRKSFGHAGDFRGYHCILQRFADTKSTLVICCNEGYAFSGLGNHRVVQGALLSILHGEVPRRLFPNAVAIDESKHDSLLGKYRLGNGDYLRISNEDGRTGIAPHGKLATKLLFSFDEKTSSRCELAWERTTALLKACKEHKKSLAAELANGEFSLAHLEEYLSELDANARTKIIAALPVPWSRDNFVRVFVQAPEPGNSKVFSLGWKAEQLFDVTDWEHKSPHRVALAADAADSNILVICDPWTKRSRQFKLKDNNLVFDSMVLAEFDYDKNPQESPPFD